MDFYALDQCLRQKEPKAILSFLESADSLAEDDCGDTLLHHAALFGSVEAVRFLIDSGADVWSVDHYNKTALHRAAEGDLEPEALRMVTGLLLEAGCPADQRDEKHEMFYHRAAVYGKTGVFQALRDAGICPNRTMDTGETVLHLLARNMHLYDYLLDQPEAYAKEEQRYLECVQLAMDCGVDPDQKTNIGKTALDFAVENRAKRIGAALKGDPLDELHRAAGGQTLHQAAAYNDTEAVAALIELGADLEAWGDAGEYRGRTALMCACAWLCPEVAELLLEKGADPRQRGSEEQTAMAELILSLRTSIQLRGKITEHRVLRIAQTLLKNPDILNQPIDKNENTALELTASLADRSFWAGDRTLPEILFPLLLRLKPDLSHQNRFGDSALHQLCRCSGERPEMMIRRLLHSGANVNLQNAIHQTPLHLACQLDAESVAMSRVQMLLEAGADCDLVNNDGQTALELAAGKGYENVVKLLLNH